MATVAELQIQQIYIGLLGRAADKAGLAYWVGELDNGNLANLAEVRASFITGQTEYMAGLGSMSRADAVETLYQRLFERAANTADLEYWVNTSTATLDELVDTFIKAANEGAGADADVLNNKAAAAAYYTENATTYNSASAASSVESVDATAASLTASMAAVDAGNTGSNLSLTDGRDVLTGTAGNDTIYGDAGQNSQGAIANGFATGDVIDGGAGTDQIIATVINDNEVDSGTDTAVHARTTNVEKVSLEAIGTTGVTIDAGRMVDVSEYWSNNSSSDLTYTDVRLGSLGITKNLTFGLKDTDYETDFTAQLDSQSFSNSGSVTSNSQVLIRIADVSTETPATPVMNVSINIGFSLGGQDFLFENITTADGTYAGLRAAIATAIAANGSSLLNNITVEAAETYNSVTFAGNTVDLAFDAQEILLTDRNGADFTDLTFEYAAISPVDDGFLVAGNAKALDPTTSSTLIEANLVLDGAGRGSQAGEVEITGMSNSKLGLERLNVSVGNDSSITNLTTVNGNAALQQIVVTSLASNGDLVIGGLDKGVGSFNATSFAGSSLKLGTTAAVENLTSFASVNAANNTLVATITEADGVNSGKAYSYNTGTGKDKITVTLDGDAVDAVDESFAVNAGDGDNAVKVTMQGAAVSVATTADLNNLSITTGSGVDKITLVGGNTGNGTTDGDADFNISAGGGSDFVHFNSMDDAGSVAGAQSGTFTFAGAEATGTADTFTITLVGGGATETVVVSVGVGAAASAATIGAVSAGGTTHTYAVGIVDGVVTVTAGAGESFIATVAQTTGTTGEVTVGSYVSTSTAAAVGSWTIGTTTGASATTLLYKANLTVNFAGFTETVVIETTAANNFVATQVDINNAIKAAIKADADLVRLLETSDSNGTQQMTIKSTVEGNNDLHITYSQPVVGTGAGNVVLDSGDVAALLNGALAQSLATVSSSTNAAALTIAMNAGTNAASVAAAANGIDVVAAGVGGGDGTDESVVTNISVIDMGAGANDLVVLNSDDDSVQTLDFTAAWGKVAVVNFFDGQALTTGTGTVGSHQLDFTAWLDDQTDASANTNNLSAVSVGRTSAVAVAGIGGDLDLDSNEVVIVNDFAQTSATSETFANMSAQNIDDALTTALSQYGNIGVSSATSQGATLVGTTQDSILMIENDLNAGEYKVFNVETTGAGATEAFEVVLLGTIDFGASIDATTVVA